MNVFFYINNIFGTFKENFLMMLLSIYLCFILKKRGLMGDLQYAKMCD